MHYSLHYRRSLQYFYLRKRWKLECLYNETCSLEADEGLRKRLMKYVGQYEQVVVCS